MSGREPPAVGVPGPAYRIESPRLLLRCFDPSDAPLLEAAVIESLEHLRPWMPWASAEPESLDSRVQRLRRWRADFDSDRDLTYGIFDGESSRLLGAIGLHTRIGADAREIGYWIHAAHLNRGYATEASAAIVKVAFEVHRLGHIEIRCDPRNVSSAAIPRKLGFVQDATLRRRSVATDGSQRDTMIWSLFPDEYSRSPAAALSLFAFDAAGRRIL